MSTLKTHFGADFFIPALLFQITATLFSFSWDIFMDWGLGNRSSSNPYLRDRLMYPSKLFYYSAMGSNLAFRFAWIISLSGIHNIEVNIALGVVEVFRQVFESVLYVKLIINIVEFNGICYALKMST